MGITSKKNKTVEVPNRSTVNEFETIPAFDNSVRDPKSGVAIPTDDAVSELKAYMNVNKQ